MLSLIVWSTMLVVLLLLPARAVAYAARRAGSPRGRFLVGLLASCWPTALVPSLLAGEG